MGTLDATTFTIDVRELAPRDRHQRIFSSFEGMAPGDALLLINDHDPKPLYYMFMAEYPGEADWRYLEQGPEVWHVRIGKLRATKSDAL